MGTIRTNSSKFLHRKCSISSKPPSETFTLKSTSLFVTLIQFAKSKTGQFSMNSTILLSSIHLLWETTTGLCLIEALMFLSQIWPWTWETILTFQAWACPKWVLLLVPEQSLSVTCTKMEIEEAVLNRPSSSAFLPNNKILPMSLLKMSTWCLLKRSKMLPVTLSFALWKWLATW